MTTATVKKKTSVNLKSLLSSVSTETQRQTWIEFQPGITFLVSYLPKAKMKQLLDKSTVTKFDPATHQRVQAPDSEKLNKLFVKACIHDWDGISVRSLQEMLPVDATEIPEDQLDDPIPFNADAMVDLMTEVYDLDGFLNTSVTDIKTFSPELESELKNSKSSQDGS